MSLLRAIPLAAAAVDQVLVSAANFCTFLLAARVLTVEAAGSYSLVFAGIIISTGVQNALIGMPLKVLGAGAELKLFARRQLALLLLLILLEFTVLVPLGLLFEFADPARWLLVVAVLMASQLHEYARARLLAELRAKRLLMLDTLSYVVRFSAVGLMIAAGSFSLDGLFVAMLLGFLTWFAYVFLWPAWTDLTGHAARVWHFGRWILLDGLAYSASIQAYLYGIALLLSLQAVAGLAAAQNAFSIISLVFTGAAAYLLPLARQRLLTQGYDAWRRLLRTATIVVTAMLALVLMALVFLGEWFLAFFYGESFRQYGPVLVALAVPAVLNGFNTFASQAFQTAERPDVGLRARVWAAVFALLWMVPGIHAFGIWGAVAGLTATPVIWAAVYGHAIWSGGLSREEVIRRLPSPGVDPLAADARQ